MSYYIGCDWASAAHSVCVIDEHGQVLWQEIVPHTADGFAALRRRLQRVAAPADLPVAIERPSGLVVDALVEWGFPVVPIHPNVLKASRPRYGMSGAKSDAGDAFILADLLRTDGHRFRPLQPLSEETRALRALVRARDDLVATRVGLANQLRAVLESFWPGAAHIFADVDSAIALAFLERYPTPQSAEHLGEKRLAAFLGRHSYCGRRSAPTLLDRLRRAPTTTRGDADTDALGEVVRALVAVLVPLVTQIQKLTSAIAQALPAHPDGPLVMSFPRAGCINAAQILAELGQERQRFTSAEHLAAEAGVAPVTQASGKHRTVTFRWACNKRLRRAITTFADNSRHASPWAAGLYQRALARGCDHPHAIRILAKAWLRVLWRCWQSSTPYQLSHHTTAQGLTIPAPKPA
ncbi:MAG TPA: IS110 family transposase [bacterium]|nr:IS110 family transposase [bacterium]